MNYPLNPRAGIANVVYSLTLIQSWTEGGFAFTVTRDSTGLPLSVKGISDNSTLIAQFSYGSDGRFNGMKGDPIGSALIQQLVVEAIGGRLVSSSVDVTGRITKYAGGVMIETTVTVTEHAALVAAGTIVTGCIYNVIPDA